MEARARLKGVRWSIPRLAPRGEASAKSGGLLGRAGMRESPAEVGEKMSTTSERFSFGRAVWNSLAPSLGSLWKMSDSFVGEKWKGSATLESDRS